MNVIRALLRRAAPLLFAILPLAAPAAPFAYVANGSDDSVSVIDLATRVVVATIALPPGANPAGVAANPALPRVYVVNNTASSVSVIDSATNTVVATTPVGAGPVIPTLNPAGTRLYVPNFLDNTMSVIDTSTNAVVATVPGFGGPRSRHSTARARSCTSPICLARSCRSIPRPTPSSDCRSPWPDRRSASSHRPLPT